MNYRDTKNAEPVNPDKVYTTHKAYYNARAYRDAMNGDEPTVYEDEVMMNRMMGGGMFHNMEDMI